MASAGTAIGSTIANSGGPSGGSYSGSSPPPTYIPTAQPTFDQYYQNIVSGLNPYVSGSSSLIPSQIGAYQTYAGDITGSPYAAGALQGAQQGAAYGAGTLYPQVAGGASSLFGLAGAASPYAGQLLQTGFDPQNALYNQLFQRTQDQSNATNAMYGLASSPYGAGLTDQALTTFNLDWQNQQLQRQSQAAGAYGGLLGNIGRGYTGGADLGNAAMNLPITAGGLPYQTQLGIDTNALNALNQAGAGYGQSLGLGGQLLGPIQSYLGLGQSATGLGQAGAAQNFANNQALGQGFGSALQGLGNLYNSFGSSPTPTYGSPDFSLGSSGNPYGSAYYGNYSGPTYDPVTGLAAGPV